MNGISAILPAAGSSRRFGLKKSKLFFKVDGKPILFYTLKNISRAYRFREILIASHPDNFKEIQKIASALGLRSIVLVPGGATRAESVRNALSRVSAKSDWVLVHDAARPLVSRRIILDALKSAKKTGGAITAIPVTATVKRAGPDKVITKTEDRAALYLAQTPQVFKKEKLLGRYKALGNKAMKLTDEASFFDGSGMKVMIAPGEESNLKITTFEDIELFRFYLKSSASRQRG